jgi:nicotinamide-nucleotide amidase
MKVNRTAELIAIGDELLNGLRANGHLVYLGDQLTGLGIGLHHACEIRDEPDDILNSLRQALDRSDLIFVTGGLGPTADDLTVACTAAALNRRLLHDPQTEQAIREFFQARGRIPTENNFKQCEIVEGALALPNPNGTAPGQWIELDQQVIVLLPGPPRELIPMFEREVLPHLHEQGWASATEAPVQLRSIGVGESKVAELLEPILAPHRDHVRVAYCAHLIYVDVRLSPLHDTPPGLLKSLGDRCRVALRDGFLGSGTPEIACLILQRLRSLNKTLAVAESCTGGLLASRFTDIAGASKVFKGGVVCYSNEIKEAILGVPGCLLQQHGAVSAECAIAMATAVAELMESDYALAITGYAGPEGGAEPAGTVYLGYHSPVGVWSHKVVLPGNRIAVKERAVANALNFLRQSLLDYDMLDLIESLKC